MHATRMIAATGMLFAASASADFSAVPAGAYDLHKSHGYILFSYSHFGLSNPSVGFNEFDATLELDAGTPENSTIEVVIDAASVDSCVPEFDEHLNSAEWLDMAKFPKITFNSLRIDELQLTIEVEMLKRP